MNFPGELSQAFGFFFQLLSTIGQGDRAENSVSGELSDEIIFRRASDVEVGHQAGNAFGGFIGRAIGRNRFGHAKPFELGFRLAKLRQADAS